MDDILRSELADEFEDFLAKSEALKKYETDLKEHCGFALEFIREARDKYSSNIILRALELSFENASQEGSFFDLFDADGLGTSLEQELEYEAEMVREEEAEKKRIEASVPFLLERLKTENARYRKALEKYANPETHSMDEDGEVWYGDYFDYKTARDALEGKE